MYIIYLSRLPSCLYCTLELPCTCLLYVQTMCVYIRLDPISFNKILVDVTGSQTVVSNIGGNKHFLRNNRILYKIKVNQVQCSLVAMFTTLCCE